MYTIVMDCMGSDKGPSVLSEGILRFVKEYQDVKIVAVGRKEDLKTLEGNERIEIVHADDVVPMTAGPLEVMRAKNSSMYKAITLCKENNYDAVCSCGSTGGFLSCATLKLKTIEGIERACLMTQLPTKIPGKTVTTLDVGANNETTPEQLVQFAMMGKIYTQKVKGVENPKVYLLSNGTEDEKGSPEIKEANKLLRESSFEGFEGNVEAREALNGQVDVIVTGGFTGNIFLKTVEGVGKLFSNMIKEAFYLNWHSKLGYLLSKKGFDDIKKTMDYKETGGAMMLGLNGVVVKGHGSSDAKATFSTLRVAYNMAKVNVVELMKEGVKGVN